MTTMTPPPTDTPPPPPPPAGPPPGAPARKLQRSRTDKVAGGVAGGLGEYFALDPVLFRVLFAVAAFFGGFGLVAYAVLWFALPESGDTTTSPVDRLGGWLKAHNVPLWLAGVVAVVGFWLLVGGFGGWWGHGFFFPGAAVIGVVLLIVAFSRRGATGTDERPPPPGPTDTAPFPPHDGPAGAPTISLLKAADDDKPMDQWYREARERGRARRRRARPLFLATLGATVVALAIVAIVDAASGVALPVYGLVAGGTVLLGLLAGVLARRPAFSLIWFLVPALVWIAAFGGTHTSFRDGAGEVAYRPTSVADLDDDYRLAFGRVTLDLRGVYDDAATRGTPERVVVRVGAGVARVVVPEDADVTVVAQVRLGAVLVDGVDERHSRQGAGWRATTRIPPTGSDGPPLLVVLQVTDGAAVLDHVAA
ncbi:PspC domain-containing protein [Jatrophihabitans sp. YIM 134969]